ncbi:MAG: sigma 54-interacting transcriptional regulator [Bacillota bacterium]|nr:sigma 54-interacting transcriptional regulator [Bacillota bacterium]
MENKTTLSGMLLNTEILDIIGSLGYFVEIVNADGIYVYCSKKDNDPSYLSRENVIGRKVTDVYLFNDINTTDKNNSILMKTISLGQPLKNMFWQYSAEDGHRYYWLMDSSPIIVNNEVIGAICMGKPFRSVKSAVDRGMLMAEADFHNEAASITGGRNTFSDIIFADDAMAKTIEQAKRIALTSSSVLLLGETGVGKEIFAQSIHNASSRSGGSFVAINCSAIPETLLESTLFGTSKGAYTGAIESKGLFETAADGTIFLDELNSMSVEIQAKLLRVIDEKKLRRVGSSTEIPITARIVSAMNSDPMELVENGKMRRDLFYRLAVATVEIPPLRKRGNDVELLTQYFIKENARLCHKEVSNVDPDVMKVFREYLWPGNVRELRHIIEHAVNIIDINEKEISFQHLPYFFLRQIGEPKYFTHAAAYKIKDYKSSRAEFLAKCEHEFICDTVGNALKVFGGNIGQTAAALNITRQHLHRLINEHLQGKVPKLK